MSRLRYTVERQRHDKHHQPTWNRESTTTLVFVATDDKHALRKAESISLGVRVRVGEKLSFRIVKIEEIGPVKHRQVSPLPRRP